MAALVSWIVQQPGELSPNSAPYSSPGWSKLLLPCLVGPPLSGVSFPWGSRKVILTGPDPLTRKTIFKSCVVGAGIGPNASTHTVPTRVRIWAPCNDALGPRSVGAEQADASTF